MSWLEDAEARAEAATPGPWQAREKATEYVWEVVDDAEHDVVPVGYWWGHVPAGASEEDARFIAAARSDLPRALALVRQLGEALAMVEEDEIAAGKSSWAPTGGPHGIALAAFREAVGGSEPSGDG